MGNVSRSRAVAAAAAAAVCAAILPTAVAAAAPATRQAGTQTVMVAEGANLRGASLSAKASRLVAAGKVRVFYGPRTRVVDLSRSPARSTAGCPTLSVPGVTITVTTVKARSTRKVRILTRYIDGGLTFRTVRSGTRLCKFRVGSTSPSGGSSTSPSGGSSTSPSGGRQISPLGRPCTLPGEYDRFVMSGGAYCQYDGKFIPPTITYDRVFVWKVPTDIAAWVRGGPLWERFRVGPTQALKAGTWMTVTHWTSHGGYFFDGVTGETVTGGAYDWYEAVPMPAGYNPATSGCQPRLMRSVTAITASDAGPPAAQRPLGDYTDELAKHLWDHAETPCPIEK